MSIISAETSTLAPPGAQQARLAESIEYCARLTRQAARNFYYGLKLLPEPKRSAMFALYAYMRLADDIADAEDGRSPEQRERDLEDWRAATRAALAGEPTTSHLVWPAFADLSRRYNLGPELFDDVIAGQEQDLRPEVFHTFEQLHEYCYRVAGVVGLASIRIWGYEGGEGTESLAIARGVAFQLTNILRDLREDAIGGRIYLPREDLAATGVCEEDLLAGKDSPRRLLDLMRLEIDRAHSFYERSAALEERIHRDSRPTLIAMTEIYRGLLDKIAADPLRVLRERVSLSLLSKLRIGWRATRSVRRGPVTSST